MRKQGIALVLFAAGACDGDPATSGMRARNGAVFEHDSEELAEVQSSGMEDPAQLSPARLEPAPSSDEPPLVAEPDPAAGGPTCSPFPTVVHAAVCVWVKETETGASPSVRADCDDVGASYYALTGGCYTSTSGELVISTPDEGSQNNMPEDQDNSTRADGWSCEYNVNATGGSHRAVAYCCPAASVASC
jgi:hypothetical protein